MSLWTEPAHKVGNDREEISQGENTKKKYENEIINMKLRWLLPVSYTHLKVYHILSNSDDLQSILENLSTHQQADPKLLSIKTRLEAGDETITQYYKIHNGILFLQPSLKKKEEWKVVIPTHIEKEIVNNYHVRYGHMGCLLYTSRCV